MIAITADTQVVTRSEWGARAPTAVTLFSPDTVTAHYNGPAIGLGTLLASHSSCASVVRGIQRFHMDTRGWTDIAYTFMVCPHGYVFQGRWEGRRTAANGTNPGNDRGYAGMFLLGEGEAPLPAMLRAWRDARDYLAKRGSRPAGINGHRDWKATACPGDPVYSWIRAGAPRPGGTADVFPLEPGDSNFATLLLEIVLVHGGQLDVVADGGFGSNTLEAVHAMQRFLHLPVRDEVTAAQFEKFVDWANLTRSAKSPRTMSDRGERIGQLRRDLHKIGQAVDPDGYLYDEAVRDAMRNVQRFFDADHRAGNATLDDLAFVRHLADQA